MPEALSAVPAVTRARLGMRLQRSIALEGSVSGVNRCTSLVDLALEGW